MGPRSPHRLRQLPGPPHRGRAHIRAEIHRLCPGLRHDTDGFGDRVPLADDKLAAALCEGIRLKGVENLGAKHETLTAILEEQEQK